MTNVGKGHIERLPSGSYRVRVYAGTDPLTGKEIRLKATAKTAEHAQAELARLLEQASVGQQPESAATVGHLLDQYMAVADLDVSTREGYEGYIRRTIKPALGGMELRKLRGPVIARSSSCSGAAASVHRGQSSGFTTDHVDRHRATANREVRKALTCRLQEARPGALMRPTCTDGTSYRTDGTH